MLIKELTLPTILTLIRIIGSFFLFLFSYCQLDAHRSNPTLIFLYGFLALTDFLDGFLARRYNQVSRLGALLDPLADKVLCNGSLLTLAWHRLIHPWMPFFFMIRDILVSSLREYAVERGSIISPSYVAKFKTALLMTSIFLFYIFPHDLAFSLTFFGTRREIKVLWTCLFLAQICAIESMKTYYKIFIKTQK